MIVLVTFLVLSLLFNVVTISAANYWCNRFHDSEMKRKQIVCTHICSPHDEE